MVAQRPQPYRRERNLVDALRREAGLRTIERRRRERNVADVEQRRSHDLLRLRSQRRAEHLGEGSKREEPPSDPIQRRPRAVADNWLRRKIDRRRTHLSSLEARPFERSRRG